MEDLYALYLKLYALKNAKSCGAFDDVLEKALINAGLTSEKQVEVGAVAAVAVTSFVNQTLPDTEYVIGGLLLSFYEFQQVWQRYRNLAPRQ